MKVFLDTNTLLDVLLPRDGLVDESAAVITRCGRLNAAMFVSWHGLATCSYLLKKGRTRDEMLEQLDQILAWAAVVTCGDAEARQARRLGFNDFEDALQAVAAESCGADSIVTRNTGDFKESAVPAISPAEFLANYALPAAPWTERTVP